MKKTQVIENDEISLAEIIGIVIQRKKVFFVVFFAVVFLGAIHSFTKSDVYKYSQLIELANDTNDSGQRVVFTPPEMVVSNVKKSYLAQVMMLLRAKYNGFSVSESAVNVDVVGDHYVSLSVNSSAENKELYKFFFNAILERLIQDDGALVQQRKLQLSSYLEILEGQLKKQLEFENAIAVSGDGGVSHADPVQKLIAISLVSGQRSLIVDVSSKIAFLKMQIAGLKNTKAATEFLSSTEPVGISKVQAFILSIIFGLVAGFIGVFLVEVASNVKKR